MPRDFVHRLNAPGARHRLVTATLAAPVLLAYAAALFGVAAVARRRVRTTEDYLVAGRRLSTRLAAASLLATWFGAGTLLASAEEVRDTGLVAAALEPIGPGLCLILVGLFYAAPLRRLRLLTLGDFFARRFGQRAEVVSALVMVPSFFGWIAAQFTVLAALLHGLFGIPTATGLLLVGAVSIGYTLIGGMWSVALTDQLQMPVVAVGLLALGFSAVAAVGEGSFIGGLVRIGAETPADRLALLPGETTEILAWSGLLLAGALGNIPGQDVMQRVFASRTESVAKRACLLAGGLYLGLGLIPVALGLAAPLLLQDPESDLLATLTAALFSPLAAVGLTVVLVSAVLSTVDSALVSAASVLAQNLLRHPFSRLDLLRLSRVSVVIVGLASLLYAFQDLSAYALLEEAYELTLVGVFVPLTAGLFTRWGGPRAALLAMAAGVLPWAVHVGLGWEWFFEPALRPGGVLIPPAIGLTLLSGLGYVVGARFERTPEPAR